MERHSFLIVSGDSLETMWKLCFSIKFPHQEIRWNYIILLSFRYFANKLICHNHLDIVFTKVRNTIPTDNYMFKVNNRNTRTRCEICSKLTIKIPERRHWRLFICLFIYLYCSIWPSAALVTIFKSFARPHLDYGDVLYDQAFNSAFQNKLESIQYNVCLAITGSIRGISREKLYQEFG